MAYEELMEDLNPSDGPKGKEPTAPQTSQDDLEIEVVDDTPERDRGRKPLEKPVEEPTDDELAAYSDGVQKRIKELTHARHDERRAKEALAREKQELERLAQAIADENRRLKEQVNYGVQQYAATALTVADTEVETAKRKLKEAHEAFDTDAIIAAQEELADAKLKQQQARSFKPQETALQPPQAVVQQQQAPEAPPPLDERTLRWQAKNQWFGDPEHEDMTLFSLGLHKKLVREGFDPRTEAYFEQVDARMRRTFPEFFGTPPNAAERAPSRPDPVVAPGSRSTGSRKIQLTPTQLALAKKYGLTPQQYAAEVLKLERNNA